MRAQFEITTKKAANEPMGLFERYLMLWVYI
jgi:hypothetical protein